MCNALHHDVIKCYGSSGYLSQSFAADILPKQRHVCTMFTLSRWFWWMSLTFLITTLCAPIEAGVAVPSRFVSRKYLFALPEETECTFVHAHRLTAHFVHAHRLTAHVSIVYWFQTLSCWWIRVLLAASPWWHWRWLVPCEGRHQCLWWFAGSRGGSEGQWRQLLFKRRRVEFECIYRLLYVGHTPLVGYADMLIICLDLFGRFQFG